MTIRAVAFDIGSVITQVDPDYFAAIEADFGLTRAEWGPLLHGPEAAEHNMPAVPWHTEDVVTYFTSALKLRCGSKAAAAAERLAGVYVSAGNLDSRLAVTSIEIVIDRLPPRGSTATTRTQRETPLGAGAQIEVRPWPPSSSPSGQVGFPDDRFAFSVLEFILRFEPISTQVRRDIERIV